MNTWLAEFGDSFNGQRILVTGAGGFIGGHLCDALLALGAEVYALDRSGADSPVGCKSVVVDLQDLNGLRTALTQIRPQKVYHLASLVTARQEMDLVVPMLFNNLVGTVHLFLALSEIGVQQVVTISSSEVPAFGIPTSPYAASKAGVHLYADLFQKIYQLPVVTVRLFIAYGPRQQNEKLIPYLIRSLLSGQSPRLKSGMRVCDFIYVIDVVRGLLKIGHRKDLTGRTVELGSGRGVSIKDMAVLATTLTCARSQPLFDAVADRIEEQSQVADLTATQALLDWSPTFSLEDGLRETIKWYESTLK